MKLEVRLTGLEEAHIIKNLYPLYLYDLGLMTNQHGIFEESNEVTTLIDQYELQNTWWKVPESLFPYLIEIDDMPVGFILIASPPYCTKGIDYFVNEMFLLKRYRRHGYAEKAIISIFDQFHGMWELFTQLSEENIIAKKFWRKTLKNYTHDHYTEEMGETHSGYQMIFRFKN